MFNALVNPTAKERSIAEKIYFIVGLREWPFKLITQGLYTL
jgi:hypothetical protein